MDYPKEEHRMKYVETLAAIGAATEICEFLADVLQCESDMMHITGKYLVEISDHIARKQKIEALANILQRIYKSIIAWKDRINDLEERKADLPQHFDVDLTKLGQVHSFKALCSLETSKTSLKEGDDVEITDLSHPGFIRVRNSDGREGYLPLLSCFVPSPDLNISNCTERLRIQMLTCASDLLNKLQMSLAKNLLIALKDLVAHLDENFAMTSSKAAILKFKGRSKYCCDGLVEGHLQLKYLAKSLRSLENDFIRNSMDNSEEVRKKISAIDRTILFFLALKDKLLAYKAEMKTGHRPIRIIQLDANTLKLHKNNSVRYYEVRLTATETTIREERTYFPPKKDHSKENTSSLVNDGSRNNSKINGPNKSGSSKHCSVQSVIDPRTGDEISIKEAVALGILDHRSSHYVNLETGEKIPMSAAITKGLIKISRRTVKADEEYDENANKVLKSPLQLDLNISSRRNLSSSEGLITLKTKVMKAEYDIVKVLDRARGIQFNASEASDLGIIKDGWFYDTETGSKLTLDEAIHHGWLEVSQRPQDAGEGRAQTPSYDEHEETFAVEGVYDSSVDRYISFIDAVKQHLVDPLTGCIVDSTTGEKIFPKEALERGLIKVRPVQPQHTLQVFRGSTNSPTCSSPASSAHRYLRPMTSPVETSNYLHHLSS